MIAFVTTARPTRRRVRRVRLTWIAIVLSLFILGWAPAALATEPASMRDFDALALQGDVKAGLVILKRIAVETLSAEDRKRRDAILSRFGDAELPKVDVEAPLARDVADVYLKYWRRCLLKEVEVPAANAELFGNLKACLNKHGKDPDRFSSLDDLTEALGPMLLAEGVYSLRGVTKPYYELMLWKGEAVNQYTVELPESTEQTKVVLMSGFVLKGWLGFATYDRDYTTGWTRKDSLHCLREAYDLDSERFRVSFLAHEAQHFSDARRFPKLEQPEQEYRAKLVELSRAEDSLYQLLEAFTHQGGTDRKSPHPFANRRVVQHLSNALFGDDSASQNPALWSQKSRGEIHEAALKLLRNSTATLQGKGADRVRRYL